ncbi:hypothetical protein EUGRSUZ_E00043 [Eucalyptus grandis]|uniref:Uncharacterized protein n=2 Tax=Eucalyptus grandis TaxID=71139 RepID=A0ACC3KQS5_EUCGR|nr:hypothetical protein EUGRSUZ_E00043 [Eucalyptus grandis]
MPRPTKRADKVGGIGDAHLRKDTHPNLKRKTGKRHPSDKARAKMHMYQEHNQTLQTIKLRPHPSLGKIPQINCRA